MSMSAFAPGTSTTKKMEREFVMGDLKFSGRKIMENFYTQLVVENPDEDGNESGLRQFRCRCGKVRIQNVRHGYTNLKHHVLLKHPEWLRDIMGDIPRTNAIETKKDETSEDIIIKKRKANDLDNSMDTESDNNRESCVDIIQGSEGDEQLPLPSPPTHLLSPPTRLPSPPNQRRRGRPSGIKTSKSLTKQTVDSTSDEARKRSDYISWDDYFMSVAFLSAMRSKDPSTQVGACIVNTDKKIVGIGYNGFPNGCSDDTLPWARASTSDNPLETKYPYVCHAEMNAILNKNTSELKGCTMYVALFPCNDCAKLIIQCGIKHIVYYSDKYHDDWKFVASRRLLDMAGVKYRSHQLHSEKLVIDFTSVL